MEDITEQELHLLEQDYERLTQTLAELQQKWHNAADKQSIRAKIADTEAELQGISLRLATYREQNQPIDSSKIKPATLYGVPPLPDFLEAFPPIINDLKAKLVLRPTQSEISSLQKNALILHAPSGMGKSLMVCSIVHNDMVRRSFVGGIFWHALGPAPDILAHQISILQALDSNTENVHSIEEGTKRLREQCANRACLIVLDDVWDVRDVLPFTQLGSHTQLIITTCDTEMLEYLTHFMPAAQIHSLKPLNLEQSITFLHYYGGETAKQTANDMLTQVAKAADFLPATLKSMGCLVAQERATTWQDLINEMRDADCTEFPPGQYCSLMQATRSSVDRLGDEAEYYLSLAVFADYHRIPSSVIVMLWQYLYHLSTEQAYSFIERLNARGLLHLYGAPPRADVHLNVYQHEYINAEAEIEKLHDHLLAAYRRQCGQHGWSNGPNDGYFFKYLCLHLQAANRMRELRNLLLDFNWIYNKLRYSTLQSLLGDYELFEEDASLELIQQTLKSIAPVILKNVNDEELLATQLLNRIAVKPTPDLQGLINQAQEMAPEWQAIR